MSILKTLVVLSLLIPCNLIAQDNTIMIIADFNTEKDSALIKFSKPIGNYPKTFYKNPFDFAFTTHGKLKKHIKLDNPGLIALYEHPFHFASAVFFAKPGDSIILSKKKDSLIFKGSDSHLNTLYNSNRLPLSLDDEVIAILKKTKDIPEILSEIEHAENKIISSFTSLLQQGKISQEGFNFLKSDLAVRLYNSCAHTLEAARKPEFCRKHNLKIDSGDAVKLVSLYNCRYNNFDPDALSATGLPIAIYITAWNMENKAKLKNETRPRFWDQFDAVFSSTMSNFGVVDFIASKKYREIFIADAIFSAIRFQSVPHKRDLIPVFEAFMGKFPNSVYLNPLKQVLEYVDKPTVPNVVLNGDDIVGSISLLSSASEPLILNTKISSNSLSLEGILGQAFPSQNLFIDCWATYCSPCIKQFAFNDELKEFLTDHQIKTLYITVDESEAYPLWHNMIREYNLVGYHLFPFEKYRKEAIMPILKYVPRYLIYNTKKQTLHIISGKPSDGKPFHESILNTLKK